MIYDIGPCKKRPGYNLFNDSVGILGRSHRSKLGKARLALAISETKRILDIPDDYLVGQFSFYVTTLFKQRKVHGVQLAEGFSEYV